MKHLLTWGVVALLLASCSRLSDDAKVIAGTYYNYELSDDLPVMELNPDGTSLMRAIKPQVLVIEVPGTWNVEHDSLIVVNDLSRVKAHGDTTIMGSVGQRVSRAITDHNDLTLTLLQDGIQYIYHRQIE